MENTRLVTILERLCDLNFKVVHLSGAKNAAAHYLSWHTASMGQALEFHKGRVAVKVRTMRSPPKDASLWKVAEATGCCQTP